MSVQTDHQMKWIAGLLALVLWVQPEDVLAAKLDAKASSSDVAAEVEDEEKEAEDDADAGKSSDEESDESSASCACADGEPPGFVLFLDFGARMDLGNFSQVSRVGQNEDAQNDDVRAWGPQAHLGFLSRIDEHWRMGGSLGYLFNYDTNNNNSLLGQLLTLDFRLEWITPIAKKWWILAGPRFGLSSIIPGGVLQDQITENQRLGFGTVSGPRLGFLVGADAGVRYELIPWLAIRGTLGYAFSMNFLLNSGASSAGISASQTWMTSTSRLSFMFGPEVAF